LHHGTSEKQYRQDCLVRAYFSVVGSTKSILVYLAAPGAPVFLILNGGALFAFIAAYV
jgi:hypothetical protein